MSDQFLGEIRLFALRFAPYGWAFCNGQLLPISGYSALFSIIGTYFGGDGRQSFALPNLQGRIPVGQGQGAGLSPYTLGQADGAPVILLNGTQSAYHTHGFIASTDAATSQSPEAGIVMKGHYKSSAGGATGPVASFTAQPPDTSLNGSALGPIGGGQPHENMMPFLTINYCIALTGEFPPRS